MICFQWDQNISESDGTEGEVLCRGSCVCVCVCRGEGGVEERNDTGIFFFLTIILRSAVFNNRPFQWELHGLHFLKTVIRDN